MFALIKGLGLGAGAMYFFDPVAGEKRRAMLVDQFSGVGRQLEGWVEDSSHDLKDRAQGLVDQASRKVDLPMDLDALNPASWPPSVRLAAGVAGGLLGLQLMRRMPVSALAIGAVGLGLAVQKMSHQNDWHGLSSDGGRVHDDLATGAHGSYAVRSPAFDRTDFSSSSGQGSVEPPIADLTKPPVGAPGVSTLGKGDASPKF